MIESMQLPSINLYTYRLLLAWAHNRYELNEWQLFDKELEAEDGA
jgi:hypothetical protein